jgi:hypothetical protein
MVCPGRAGEPAVAVINATIALQDAQLEPAVAALQVQVRRDFLPAWGASAALVLVGRGQPTPPGAWQLVVTDATDVGGALSTPQFTDDHRPLGFARVGDALGQNCAWTAAVSRGLLTLLADPWRDRTALAPNGPQDPVTRVVPYRLTYVDVTSPVARDTYPINGVAVADFVTPAYFDPRLATDPAAPLDHLQVVRQPLELRPGGYRVVWNFATAAPWRPIFEKGKECLAR